MKDTRVPEFMPPKRLVTAIKKALGVPVYGAIRHPLPKGGWRYSMRRVA